MITKTFLIILALARFGVCGIITLYRNTGSSGPGTNLNVSDNCIPTLDSSLDMDIESINTHNHCVQLYKKAYCTGDYLVMRPGSTNHNNLGFYGFANKVRSIGPCFEKCHPDRIEGPLTEPIEIQFYGNSDRPSETFTLQSSKCRDITDVIDRWPDPHFRVKIDASTCIEIHQFGDCTGDSAHLTVGKHSSAGKVTFWPDVKKAGSISLCGYNCNHSYALEELDRDDIEPEDKSIILFRHIDFAGERTSLVLRGCTPLPQGWGGSPLISPRSVISYGQCVQLYEDEGCKDGSELEAVLGAEPFLVWGNKSLKAIKTCPFIHEYYCGHRPGGTKLFMVGLVVMCLVVILIEAVIIYKISARLNSNHQGISQQGYALQRSDQEVTHSVMGRGRVNELDDDGNEHLL